MFGNQFNKLAIRWNTRAMQYLSSIYGIEFCRILLSAEKRWFYHIILSFSMYLTCYKNVAFVINERNCTIILNNRERESQVLGHVMTNLVLEQLILHRTY